MTDRTDDFNRASLGTNWTNLLNSLVISASTVLKGNTSGDNIAYWNADTFANDQYSELQWVTIGDGGGPMVRVGTGPVGYLMYAGDSIWNFAYYRVSSGPTFTMLGSLSDYGGASIANGDTYRITVTGTTIQGYRNGSSVSTSRTDSTYSSGQVGVHSWNTNAVWDNWIGGPIASGAQSLTPAAFSDTNTFFAPTISATAGLAPALYSDTDSFFAPAVASAGNLAPSIYSDSDAFFAPAFSETYGLTPGLFSDTDTFYVPIVGSGLLPSKITDTDSILSPTSLSVYGLTPGVLIDTSVKEFAWLFGLFEPYYDEDTFWLTRVSSTIGLTPGRVVDTDTIQDPTVSTSITSLTPALYNDADVIRTNAVASSYSLTPSLLSDDDSIESPAAAPGEINLLPTLHDDPSEFYSPETGGGVATAQPTLYLDDDLFFEAAIAGDTQNITGEFFPELFVDAEAYPAPIIVAAAIQDVSPGLVSDSENFYSTAVVPGEGALTASLLSDSDTISGPDVTAIYGCVAGLVADNDNFYEPLETPGVTNISPMLFVDYDIFGPGLALPPHHSCFAQFGRLKAIG